MQEYEQRDTDGIYIINFSQAKKLVEAINLSKQICSAIPDCKLKTVPLDAKEFHGYFSLSMPVIHFYDETMKWFAELIQIVSVMCVFHMADETTTIEFNVQDIYIKQ